MRMIEDMFVRRLMALRQARGVSARDMSLRIGQNKNYISQIENGKMLPSMMGFFYICEYLKVSPGQFFDERTADPAALNALVDAARGLDGEALKSVMTLVNRIA